MCLHSLPDLIQRIFTSYKKRHFSLFNLACTYAHTEKKKMGFMGKLFSRKSGNDYFQSRKTTRRHQSAAAGSVNSYDRFDDDYYYEDDDDYAPYHYRQRRFRNNTRPAAAPSPFDDRHEVRDGYHDQVQSGPFDDRHQINRAYRRFQY